MPRYSTARKPKPLVERQKSKNVKKLAKNAAKKVGAPPPESEDEEANYDEIYEYFATKVLPNTLSVENARRKLNEKQTESESKVQNEILKMVENLNSKLKGQKSIQIFKNPSFKLLYNKLTNLQVSQRFTAIGWKCLAYAVLIPMNQETSIFVSLVYHTKKSPVFFNWALLEMLEKPVHLDEKLNPVSEFVTVEHQNEIGLVENSASDNIENFDWLNQSNLEDLLDRSNSSSIDSGTTIKDASLFPSIEVNDISGVELPLDDDITPSSYFDASFIPINTKVKRKLTLSGPDIEVSSMSNKIQSTPRFERSEPVQKISHLHPKLAKSLKRTHEMRENSVNKPRTYFQKMLAAWFKKELPNISLEIQNELERME